MNILQYNDLHPGRLQNAFDLTVEHLRAGNFRAADVKKLNKGSFYRAKLSDADRLLFKFGLCKGETNLLLLEIIEMGPATITRLARAWHAGRNDDDHAR